MHNQTHTGEKPFKCKLCPQAFSRNFSLTHHSRIHTGEKPFVCTHCFQAFFYNSSLKRHYQRQCSKTLLMHTC
ncbi:unnamed protein product [Ixodes pacificus]